MNHAIIVAGGKGLRMGSELPKQFLPVGGKPVLMHTIERFLSFDREMKVILVLPREQQDFWHELCRKHRFEAPHRVVDGGPTRFHSSMNGLDAIADHEEGLVGIHDGVRPFPSLDTISRCYQAAEQAGAAIPVMPVVDTLRKVSRTEGPESPAAQTEAFPAEPSPGPDASAPIRSVTVPRSSYRIVQTPQVFDIQLIKNAFRQASKGSTEAFTDDASVAEAAGISVRLVEGNRENIKLTTPFDMRLAELLAGQSSPA
ncbi:MAG: 2-C-methyl-D-erythritol 4-phosphate cytidylyltransferase [Prevotella sp.]|nr:2-C-methyl-D-erythritol 4-phosphate cytidylyltransferase [Prevotella sp.]